MNDSTLTQLMEFFLGPAGPEGLGASLRHHLCREGMPETVSAELERKAPGARDVQARLGQVLFDLGYPADARTFFEKDHRQGAMSPAMKAVYAQAVTVLDGIDGARTLVEEAYAEDPDLRDGLAGCVSFLPHGDPVRRNLYAEDGDSGRLSPGARLEYAVELGLDKDMSGAMDQVRIAYGQDPLLKDGHATIGSKVCVPGHDFDAAVALYRTDLENGRLSPRGMAAYGALLGRTAIVEPYAGSRLERAVAMVEEAYAASPGLKNGFVGIAREFRPAISREDAEKLFARDWDDGRMDLAGLKYYVIYLFSMGALDELRGLVRDAYAARPDFFDCFVSLARHCEKQFDDDGSRGFYEYELTHGRMSTMGKFSYFMFLLRKNDVKRAGEVSAMIPEGDSHYPLTQLALGKGGEEWKRCLPSLVSCRSVCLQISKGAEQSIEYVRQYYGGNPHCRDLLSCCARYSLLQGDMGQADRLFREDLETGRAKWDSVIQYAQLKEDAERAVLERRAYGMRGRSEDAWLAANRDRHAGETCFIVGTGPSMNSIDCSKLKGRTVFSVNGAIYLPGLETTYFVSVSDVFWRHHTDALKNVRCSRRFLPRCLKAPLESDVPTSWLNAPMPRIHDDAMQLMPVPLLFSDDVHSFASLGGTVMIVCLQLAWHLGFKSVVLLGIDHSYGSPEVLKRGVVNTDDYGDSHFMKDYYKSSVFFLDYMAMERGYEMGRDYFERGGRRILNATPGTKLDVYPKIDLDDYLEGKV